MNVNDLKENNGVSLGRRHAVLMKLNYFLMPLVLGGMTAQMSLKKDKVETLVFSAFFLMGALALWFLKLRKLWGRPAIRITDDYIAYRWFGKIPWSEIHSAMEVGRSIYMRKTSGKDGASIPLVELTKDEAKEALRIVLARVRGCRIRDYEDINFGALKSLDDIGYENQGMRVTGKALEGIWVDVPWERITAIYFDSQTVRVRWDSERGWNSSKTIRVKKTLGAERLLRAIVSRMNPDAELDPRVADMFESAGWAQAGRYHAPGVLNILLIIVAPVMMLYTVGAIYDYADIWGSSYGYLMLPFLCAGIPWTGAILTCESRQQALLGLSREQVVKRVRKFTLISLAGSVLSVCASVAIHEVIELIH